MVAVEINIKLTELAHTFNAQYKIKVCEPIFCFCFIVEEGKTKNLTDDNTKVTSAQLPEENHDEIPEIQEECVEDNLNPVDVAVGIVFGTLGVGIVGALFYYFAKKIHHRQRMQRFRQYR